MWRSWSPHKLLMRCLNGPVDLENSMTVPQVIKHRVPIWPSSSNARYIPKIKENLPPKTYTQTFIATSFIIIKKWKQPKCLSTDEWMNKLCYIYTMEYYSSIKRNGVLIHAIMQMHIENLMLRERSQSQKGTYGMIPFIWSIHNRQIYGVRK